MTTINDLYTIDDDYLKCLFEKYTYMDEVLPNIHNFIMDLGNRLDDNYFLLKKNVWVHKTVIIESNVEIIGPCIIMENSIIRHNAYLRENVFIGKNSIVGNSCEIKNAILMSKCEIPHFNYVGDSILGNKVHLGAGVILSNLRLDKRNIMIEGRETNLRKIGSFIGDNVQIGCNSVLNPGTIIYPGINIYPLMNPGGVIQNNITNKDITLRRC